MRDTGRNAINHEGQKIRRKPGRVPTACAECRRLKLRCDKNVPCQKCVSRGCGSICPDGSLTPGKGNRLVLANTQELHDQIERLSSRIRLLEDALQTLQATISSEPHPLLQTEILPRSTPQPIINSANASTTTMSSSSSTPPPAMLGLRQRSSGYLDNASREEHHLVDAFGTLALGSHDHCGFLGRTARPEYLIRAMAPPPSESARRVMDPMFPKMEVSDKTRQELFHMRPPFSEAVHLFEIYEEYGKYMYTPIPRSELNDEILIPVYQANSFEALPSNDSLGLLFIVFALAALFDPNRPPNSQDAQDFYYASRAALSFNAQATLLSTQAFIHIAQYLDFADCKTTDLHTKWVYTSHAVRSGHSMGLHLDGARWNLAEPIVRRRSRLFWQLFHLDTWGSFSFGRPPIMSTAYIDCPIPKDMDDPTIDAREKSTCCDSWNWQYSALLHSIMETTLACKLPSYDTILSLDSKVRDFPVPDEWSTSYRDLGSGGTICDEDLSVESPQLLMRRWVALSSKEISLLNLHRVYFAQALQESPADLSRHRYIPSVMAVFRSGFRIIEGLDMFWRKAPHVFTRTSLPWSQVLSAAIVMCSIVTRWSTLSLSGSALAKLDTLVELFRKASPDCRPAANLLDTIQRLHKKAYESMNDEPSPCSSALTDTELDCLGGNTYFFSDGTLTECAVLRGIAAEDVVSTDIPHEFCFEAISEYIHPSLGEEVERFLLGGSSVVAVDDDGDGFQPFGGSGVGRQSQRHYLELQVEDGLYGGTGYQPFLQQQQQQQHQPRNLQGSLRSACEQSPPLILDVTWQSFVEQLGF